jgi:hypothetical protein
MTNLEQKVINFLFHTKLGYIFICLCFLRIINLGFNLCGVDDYFVIKYNIAFVLTVIICSFFVNTD